MSRRILYVSPLVAVSGIVAACTHDFGQFEGPAEETDAATSASGDAGAMTTDAAVADAKGADVTVPDGGCVEKASCYSTHSSCDDGCEQKKDDCYDACDTAPGSKTQCRARCRNDRDTCRTNCRNTCRTCAGAACASPCG